MLFDLEYKQLAHVANDVRADMIAYDSGKAEHRKALREALPRFLGNVFAVHGTSFSEEHLDAVIEAIDAKIIEVDFMVAAMDACSPIEIIGLATGVPSFGVEPDKYNNLIIYPIYHGEDFSVDPDKAKLFRERTRTANNPSGTGAGSWGMRRKIMLLFDDPDWVYAGRDNAHHPENIPIIGVMEKNGSVRGTKQDSPLLQIHGLTPQMKSLIGDVVETFDLPADALGITKCPNNFFTRWASADGNQQIEVTFTRKASTSDGQPEVWAKIKSNRNLPDEPILKEVLKSLFEAGITKMESPERCWGVPVSRLKDENDICHVLGASAPAIQIHAHKEEVIARVMQELGAENWVFGDMMMVSGVVNPRLVDDQVAVFGQKVPDPTEVQGIDPKRDANKPYFNVVDDINKAVKRIMSGISCGLN